MMNFKSTGEAKAVHGLSTRSSNGRPNSGGPGFLFLAMGVVFPLLVVIVELSTRMCAQDFFDPMPSIWHTLLVIFVPLANLAVWIAARRPARSGLWLLGVANGAALGVSLYYTMLFVPILPLALIAVLIGIGLLPFGPLCAFVAAIIGHTHLRRLAPPTLKWGVPATVLGIAISLVAIIAADLHTTATRLGLKMAASEDAQTRQKGTRWLRWIGNDELMLRHCYHRPKLATDLVSLIANMGEPVRPEKAREIYYRVTGTAYNSHPPPKTVVGRGSLFEQFTLDSDQGGMVVGGRLRGLNLESSRLDGSLDGDAALAYVEWTLEFKNQSGSRQEARAQIALPPGGVVSRVTLWVNGEEREAAFAGRQKVRDAYTKIVKQRRDPVLVTTSGPDRVLVQCFPVEPDGGRMKVRLGITTPLLLVEDERVSLRLPYVVERNFNLAPQARHLVWIESKRELLPQIRSLAVEQTGSGVYAVRGSLTEAEMVDSKASVAATRSKDITRVWADDDVTKDGHIVVQTLEHKPTTPPDRVVLILDGSRSMQSRHVEIVQALRAMPEGTNLTVISAQDTPQEIVAPTTIGSEGDRRRIMEQLGTISYVGGNDNVPALARAWDLALQGRDSAVVWVHGPQPVLMESLETLRQKWERRQDNLRLYEVDAAPGPNMIVEELDGLPFVEKLPRPGRLQDDLERLFSGWRYGAGKPVFIRERRDEVTADLEGAKKTSDHLVRIWAQNEASRLAGSRAQDAKKQAVELGMRYNLVTARTGAVVLETDKQFRDAGLAPAAASQIPTIPEPETWALLAVVLLAMLVAAFRRRRLQWAGRMI